MIKIPLENSALRSAGLGESLAERVTDELRRGEKVYFDFSNIEVMTPSFANAFLMTLLDRFALADLKARCVFANRSATVVEVMNRSVRRYQNGIRLTTQVAPAAAIG